MGKKKSSTRKNILEFEKEFTKFIVNKIDLGREINGTGNLMKPINNEEAIKLRSTLFGSRKHDDGSKMVAAEDSL